MAALEPQYMAILKKVLLERFVQFLPPLLDTKKPAEEQADKQLSRAFSAFALHKLLDINPQVAAGAVVDDFRDEGIDAIYYEASSETLYLVQSKLKASAQFKQEDADPFCRGIRRILHQDFDVFNDNVKNRKLEIENPKTAATYRQKIGGFNDKKELELFLVEEPKGTYNNWLFF